jgi:hypothetical protein
MFTPAARAPVSPPAALRRRLEHAGGVDLADVAVHADSPLPARHDADAFAVGTDIHLGPDGADLLAHELWHVVQQRQGRVGPTGWMAGMAVNADPALEREAEAVAGGSAPATGAAAAATEQPVAQFGRTKKKDKQNAQPPGPRLVNVEDTSSKDIAAQILGDNDPDLALLMQEAALAALKTYAFHATRSSSAPNILRGGLDPSYGGTGAAKGAGVFEQHSKNKIHYTRKLGLAEDYQRYFQGGTPFGPSRKVAKVEAAEVLQVVISNARMATEAVDPDSAASDMAFTNTVRVPGAAIRSLKPQDVAPSDTETELPELSPDVIRSMLVQGAAESYALITNMSATGRRLIEDMLADNDKLDLDDVMLMLRQGLHSFRLEDLVDFGTLLNMHAGGRATLTPTGRDPQRYKDRWQ